MLQLIQHSVGLCPVSPAQLSQSRPPSSQPARQVCFRLKLTRHNPDHPGANISVHNVMCASPFSPCIQGYDQILPDCVLSSVPSSDRAWGLSTNLYLAASSIHMWQQDVPMLWWHTPLSKGHLPEMQRCFMCGRHAAKQAAQPHPSN